MTRRFMQVEDWELRALALALEDRKRIMLTQELNLLLAEIRKELRDRKATVS